MQIAQSDLFRQWAEPAMSYGVGGKYLPLLGSFCIEGAEVPIMVIGYSLPETDVFFKYLYALGTVGKKPLERFWVFDPDRADRSGSVKDRFSALLGPGAEQRFRYFAQEFVFAIDTIQSELKVAAGPG